MSGNFDLHAVILTAISTGAAAKFGMMLARTMPPPPQSCGFWRRWCYDFIQNAAENQDKSGKTQDPTKPVGVEQPVLAASASQVNLPADVMAMVAVPVEERKGGK